MNTFKLLWVCLVIWAHGTTIHAQELQALARVDVTNSNVTDKWVNDVELRLALSQPVPYRVFTLADPYRVVLDFKEIDWTNFTTEGFVETDKVTAARFGLYQPGWSRMVLELSEPMRIFQAEMSTNNIRGNGEVYVRLKPTNDKDFRTGVRAVDDSNWELPSVDVPNVAKTRQTGDRPLVVVIDAGHGGLDSGAEFQGFLEKEMVLQFSIELKEALIRSGRYIPKMTREDDTFISLPRRIVKARELEADIMISIHADAVLEGSASGTTVYTLSEEASDKAAGALAAQLDRADLLSGVDLANQDDELAGVLMDMARTETNARSELLADMVVAGIAQSVGKLRARPHLHASFSVLRAPDIPSILIELGFVNNTEDLRNLVSVPWRRKVINGIISALDSWQVEDAAQAKLLRQ